MSNNITGTGYAQNTELFQCQSSSEDDEQVFTPNIPDLYFDRENALNFRTANPGANLTRLSQDTTFIFTIPPVSAQRDCSGTVVAMQFCYEFMGNPGNNAVDAFQFLSLTNDGLNNYTVNNSFTVQTAPSGICTDNPPGNINRVCCDKVTTNQLQIPSSSYSFGIVLTRDVLLIAFNSAASEYNFDHFQVPGFRTSIGTTTPLPENTLARNRSLPLLRFFIGK